jgi:hypothetical protein
MAKLERERAVREKRQRKQEKQEAKKMAAALEASGQTVPEDGAMESATEDSAADEPAV